MEFNRNGGIDLHIHSTASDGTLTPSEILALAKDQKLRAISITDHDTTDGSKEVLQTSIPNSIEFLTGVEISADPPPSYPGIGSFHILGYNIRLDHAELNQALSRLQDARKNRNPYIIHKLNNLGLKLSLNDVIQIVGKGQIGRPHIARALVVKKYVGSINEAFDKFLSKGKPAYVEKNRIPCEQAIKLIINAGGIPVLAHPVLLKTRNNEYLEKLIVSLIEMGLKGIEVFYPDHTPELISKYSELAVHYHLLMTGGTDFHGSLNPEIQMGSGKGDLFIPYELYEKIKG